MSKTQITNQRQQYVGPETTFLDIELSVICTSKGVPEEGTPEDFTSIDYDFFA